MGKLCGVCLYFYVSKVVGKWYLHPTDWGLHSTGWAG